MSMIRKINPTLKQKIQSELQQVRVQGYETMRHRFQKRKVGMLTLCSKKDLQFLLNSLLQGDIFQQDILNQFWQANFKQTATVGQIIKVYNNSLITILHRIIQNNIFTHQLSKQRQKYKQDHNFKYVNLASQELQQINQQINQYVSDLQEYCKPFNIHLNHVIAKYKPYRLKDKVTIQEDVGKVQVNDNVFQEYQETATKKELYQDDQITTEQKYYRFVIYLTVFISIVDLSLSYSKFNFLDLSVNLLLLLNSLLQYYLFRQQHYDQTFQFIVVNYQQNKICINDVMSVPLHMRTLNTMSLTLTQQHSFQKYTYASFCLLSVSLVFDVLWILIMRDSFMYIKGGKDGALLGGLMWRYNHYVVYGSYITAVIKAFMLVLLSRTVSFQWRKLGSRFNFYINFVRFTSSSYINQLIVNTN